MTITTEITVVATAERLVINTQSALRGPVGLSPYQEWLTQGYTGSYQDFLASLGAGTGGGAAEAKTIAELESTYLAATHPRETVFITDMGDLPVPAYAIGTTWRLFGSNTVVANDPGPFSMPGLFARGALGAYFKAADLATQRQYSDGTRPVSELGQGVGLWLDQSKEGEISANMVTKNATGSTGNNFDRAELNPAAAWVAGQWYRMDGFYDGTFDTEPVIKIGDDQIIRPPRSFTGPIYFRAPDNVQPIAPLYIAGANNGSGGISWANLTCVAVYGNHAYQGNNGQRPIARDQFLHLADGMSLTVDFLQALGSACTVVRVVPGFGSEFLTGQAITDTYSLTGDMSGALIINRALTNSERAGVVAWANDLAGVREADPTLAVTQFNAVNYWTVPVAPGREIMSRVTHKIAGGPGVTEITPSLSWFVTRDSSTGLSENIGNAGDIRGVSMELVSTGKVVEFLFDVNSKTIVLADGTADLHANTVPVSAFDVAELPYLAIFKVKTKLAFPNGGNMPVSARSTAHFAGDQSLSYNPANTTVSSIAAPGPITWTGAAPDETFACYTPIMLGRFAEPGALVGLIDGTSIPSYSDDSVGTTSGTGFWQRSLEMMPVQAAGVLRSIPGSKVIAGLHSTRMQRFARYCTFSELEGGANDVPRGGENGITAQSVYATQLIRMSDNRAQGISHVGAYHLMCVTNWPSDDVANAYSTEAGQTVVFGWGFGQVVDQYNAMLSAGPFDYVMLSETLRGIDRHKWLANGTPNWITNDGIHLQHEGHVRKATESWPVRYVAITA